MRFFGPKRRRWRWKNKRSLLYVFCRHWLMEEVEDVEPRPEPVHVVEHNGCGAEVYVNKTRFGKEFVLRCGRYQLVGSRLVLVEYVTPADLADLREVLWRAQRWFDAPPSRRSNGRRQTGRGVP
jgi:hypothetical protein